MSFAARLAPRSPAAVGGGVQIGFNFRAAEVSQTDGPIDYYCGWGNFPWPWSFSGKLFDTTAGWWSPAGAGLPGGRGDHAGALDPRLGGNVRGNNSGVDIAFRVELPAGTYRVWLGTGQPALLTWLELDLYDGLTELNHGIVLQIPGNQSPGSGVLFSTAQNTWHNEADWISNYDPDFATVVVTDRGAMNDVDSGTGLDFRFIASPDTARLDHIRVVQQ